MTDEADNPVQEPAAAYNLQELGTFKDSMQAPIHGWFRYPAGYSYKFVDATFDRFDVQAGDYVYDPFSGTGTTLICAKQRGIHGYGVEAHSFVHWVADVKLYWEFDYGALGYEIDKLLAQSRAFVNKYVDNVNLEGVFPELVHKCYHPNDLKVLYLLREFINSEVIDYHFHNLLKLALTDTLRSAAAAGTGWPYISPRKNNGRQPPKDALSCFQKTVRKMQGDLEYVAQYLPAVSVIQNVYGDSRECQSLADGQIKLALTSPPYLNNYDYADRTRLETYFWGITRSWSDITEQFRDKLMTAATTQVTRSKHQVETTLSSEILQISPTVYQTVQEAVLKLSQLRLQKGGKKDYDLMTALYFNDMLRVIKETYRVLQEGGTFCLVLGDSAPYGVHIKTDELIGELALGIGFSKAAYQEFRQRGDKWRDNPQRHRVKLREGVVILSK
jgi:DNA modification methylase